MVFSPSTFPKFSGFKKTEEKTLTDLSTEEKDFLSNYLDVKIAYDQTYNSFYQFTEKIFSRAAINLFGKWISGDYVKRSCDYLQDHKWSMYLGPRQHFKSVRFYDHIMWLIWKNIKDKRNIRIYYLSFNKDLSELHVKNIKDLVSRSIFSQYGLVDLAAQAKTSASYTWDPLDVNPENQHRVDISSFGIMGGLRGGHCEYLYCDDPYRDDRKSESGAEPAIVSKINDIFDETIIPMPVQEGNFYVIGTPQSWGDIFFQERFNRMFANKMEPAVITVYSEREGKDVETALWPEMFPMYVTPEEEKAGRISLEVLRATIPEAKFNQEYMCKPRTASDSFFEADRIQKSIELGREKGLINFDFTSPMVQDLIKNLYKGKPNFGTEIYASYDPGKKRHPGHFVVMKKEGNSLHQLLSKWFDGWDYAYTTSSKPSQFSYIQEAIRFFGGVKGWADNTNGVLSTAFEQGLLPGFEQVHISHTARGGYASALEQVIGTNQFLLVDDSRQKRALLGVLSNLQMIEEKDHHAEPFTTLGMLASYVLAKEESKFRRVLRYKFGKENIVKMYRGFF
jgi:hypothetical protein